MTFKNKPNAIWVGLLLALGAGLIETHFSFYLTLFGMASWAVAIRLMLPWFPETPGPRPFSSNPLLTLQGNSSWKPYWVFLLGLVIVFLIGVSRVLFESDFWILLFACLFAISALFYLLEKHSPAFWPGPASIEQRPFWIRKLPEILILAVGGVFLFWPLPRHLPYFICDNGDNDSVFRFAADFALLNGWTTPYTDVWTLGYPAMPSFMEGIFLRLVGVSKLKDVLFFSIINLAGFFYFYRTLCFYISKKAALFAALLFASSHLSVFFARQNYPAVGFLLPVISATLYYFIKAMEEGKAKDFALLGTLWAFGFMGYITGRFYVFAFMLLPLLAFFGNAERLKKQKWLWLFAFGVCALWYLPMFVYYLRHFKDQNDVTFMILPLHLFGQYAVGNSLQNGVWSMLTSEIRTYLLQDNNAEMVDRPFLSSWETVLFIGGFAWCLLRCYKTEFAILFAGLGMGLLADAVSMGGQHIPHRLVTGLPFAYVFVGVGIDRLERAIRASFPNGRYAVWSSNLFLGVFLVFALMWQYDVFFHQITRSRQVCINEMEDAYGNSTRQHLAGWDTYDIGLCVLYHPDLGAYYVPSQKGNIDLSPLKNIPLPLTHVPEKGAFVILPDEDGRFFSDWLQYYYPEAKEKDLYNSFGDTEFRTWELTPEQIRQALQSPKPKPNSGLALSWYDHQGRLLGQWQVPALNDDLLENQWFRAVSFAWDKTAFFRIRGYYRYEGKKLVLKTVGKVSGKIGPVAVRFTAKPDQTQLSIPLSQEGWVSVNLQYQVPAADHFDLDLSEQQDAGWKGVPPARLRMPGPVPGSAS